MSQQIRGFLIVSSQVDLRIFKDCESFAAVVVEAYGRSNVVEWAHGKEFHADSGENFHMSINSSPVDCEGW